MSIAAVRFGGRPGTIRGINGNRSTGGERRDEGDGGVGFTLIKAAQSKGDAAAGLVALAVPSVVVSWAVVHTVFTLRYAGLYYGDPVGGIDFNEDIQPDFLDFAYLAFTIGMTYQVSDTDLTSRPMRRTALRHGVLSFLFGTFIVAMTINVVAGLLK